LRVGGGCPTRLPRSPGKSLLPGIWKGTGGGVGATLPWSDAGFSPAQGLLRGFKGGLIHIYNKGGAVLQDTDYFRHLAACGNVILLGDSLGDLRMSEGVQSLENILRIGFLNNQVDQFLEKYMASFDIVLVNDETLEVVNAILNHVLQPAPPSHSGGES
ncbi:cytosolic 5'-nucleotidase 3-like, partial [Hypanus sabinus]|uniref:cytosolic 5'-nucleotidase 3-like n=1 Tax=Hypanus sabinus TaxID=79690 RepID=UPI0028C47A94